jgi:hypothetical protein
MLVDGFMTQESPLGYGCFYWDHIETIADGIAAIGNEANR